MTLDTDPGQERVTLTEAALHLGVSRDALRLRLRRGKLAAVKVDGVWYVDLPRTATTDTTAVMTPDKVNDDPRTDPDTGHGHDTARVGHDPGPTPDSPSDGLPAHLVEELGFLRQENTRLWGELERRGRELERKDAIILALAQRPMLPVGEPPAPAHPPESEPTPTASPQGRLPLWKAVLRRLLER